MEKFQEILMYGCLCGMVAIGVAIFLWKVAAPAWREIRRFFSLPRVQQVVVGICVVGLIQFAATKQAWVITFGDGIKQSTQQESIVTNNLVEIHWERNTSGGIIVPESATVYIDYRSVGSSNEWQQLATTYVGAWGWSGSVNNATGYCYNVWAYYIPPEPVHTNGTWVYKTMKDRSGRFAIPLRARTEINGEAIATPKAKREDNE